MEAVIYVTRMRYLRDGRTGRTPTYTEYKLYIDNELIFQRRAGGFFKSVKQFKKWCLQSKKVIDLGITEITIEKPTTHNLGFHPSSLP